MQRCWQVAYRLTGGVESRRQDSGSAGRGDQTEHGAAITAALAAAPGCDGRYIRAGSHVAPGYAPLDGRSHFFVPTSLQGINQPIGYPTSEIGHLY